MNVGGIQKSLLELLKALSKEGRYDVSLFLCHKAGDYLEQIPEEIHILQENPYAKITEIPLSQCKQMGMRFYCRRLMCSIWSKCFGKAIPAKLLCKRIGKIEGIYDVAISFVQPIEDKAFCALTNEIVLDCAIAKKKATFIHCDFGAYGGNTKRNRNLYRRFHAIATVSDSVGHRFMQIVPDQASKVQTVYNFCDSKQIYELAQKEPVEYERPCIITVARLSEEKGLLRCVPLFARLRDQGISFEWHIVGGGNLLKPLQDAIQTHGLEKMIILEGQQINPYRYIRNADYFLLPSYHEAAPMVYDEAMVLQVPFLTTRTLSAKELVEDRGIGIVCDNTDTAIEDMLRRALKSVYRSNRKWIVDGNIPMKQFDELCKI